ncbi:GUN4 domain-containing protein [Nostoc edaphicum CCNP1411]|uniref:GUN4 domain-containing protein n=1 Tax=Nostoc edaphicum CCNP1411 TaxID=1472755 RepID=A0A7D7R313_9NOSO|nr:GUN4 domain-containing protein [Nostoc edaphicum]QMS88486.1 GUN4 domain-containing protein [Nostoc edaphicum CCNP1411]
MFKAGNDNWKTPLGYYEKAIEELRRSREELQDMKANTNLYNIELNLASFQTEIKGSKSEIQTMQERLANNEETAIEAQMALAETQKASLAAQTELQALKEIMTDEQKSNYIIFEELRQIKEQISQLPSHVLETDSQTSILKSLSDVQLHLSQLAAELTLVSHTSGIDYRKLQELLAEQKWQEADKETYSTMLKICDREGEGFLDSGEIQKFPRHDLYIINKLWVQYSEGRFGFSVQHGIWQAKKDCKRFAYKVGWLASLANSEWVKYEEYTFTLDAPKGHFPSVSRLVGLDSRNISALQRRLNIFLSRY